MSERTVAEETYSALLLSTALPRTRREFQRIIVAAVLVRRQLESELAARLPTGPGWQAEEPTETGPWEIACGETDFEASLVTVFLLEGELWVDDPVVGKNPLDHYHGGLTDLHWRKAVPVEAGNP